METNKNEPTEKEFKDFNKLYLNLMRAFDDEELVMRLPTFMTSLAYFLSEMSERAVKYGINKDDFIDSLAAATKYVNELEDKKTNKVMETSKTSKGCQSQKDNDSQSAGIKVTSNSITKIGDKLIIKGLKP